MAYAVTTQTLRCDVLAAGEFAVAEELPGARCSIQSSEVRNIVARKASRYPTLPKGRFDDADFTMGLELKCREIAGACVPGHRRMHLQEVHFELYEHRQACHAS